MKKAKIFGRSIPVLAIVAIVASAGLVSAALLSYYGKITTTAKVQQSVVVDGKNYLNPIEESITTVGGNTVMSAHFLINRSEVPAGVRLETSYSAVNINGIGMDPAGVTTTYWKVPDTSGISIDGVLTPGEWDGATSYALVPNDYTVYVTADDEFMYVAFDYAVTVGSDFASFNTYKEGTFDPETINAPCVTPDGPVWDTIVDEEGDGFGPPFVGWAREAPTTRYDCAVGTATEMKVPLAELGLALGDDIKTIFVLNEHMVGAHVYPEGAGAFDLSTYIDLAIGTEISAPITLQPGETLDFYIVNEFDVKLVPGTYTITTTVVPE